MEKLNIAELLRDCPKGTKLYSPIFGEVELEKVYRTSIVVKNKNGMLPDFYSDGKYHSNGECMLFPSKENRDWSTFQKPFEDGDILTCKSGSVFIYKGPMYNNQCDFYCGYRISDGAFVRKLFKDKHFGYLSECRFASEKEKQKLFQVINDNGYIWNPETKTLEELTEPKFRVGDRVRLKSKPNYIYTIHSLAWDYNKKLAYRLLPNNDKHLTLVSLNKQDNYELVPDKFDTNNLRPFDKVLVRYNKDNKWCGSFFSHIDKEHHSHCYKYVTTAGKSYPYCIPYEENKHLLGTTDDCSDFYKTWEE